MRGRVLILSGFCTAGLALAGCSGDGDDKAAVSSRPAETVTVTAPAEKPKSKKDTTKAGEQDKRTATEKAPAADPPELSGGSDAPAPSGNSKKQSADKVPAGQVEATNGSPPEVTLAVIDEESAFVKKSTVSRYAGLLDRLEADCSESRQELAEAALTASHETAGTDNRLSILQVLRAVVASRPSGVCLPAFTRVSR